MNNWRCTVLLPTPEGAQNIAQRQLNIAILSATRWQNNHLFRQVLGKFLIVSTDLHPAIATTHHYKLLEGSVFHSLHNLVGKSADLCMGKITDDFSLLYRHRRLANHCYHLREVLVPFLVVGICFQPELPVELSVKTLSLQEAFGSGGTTQLAVKMIGP